MNAYPAAWIEHDRKLRPYHQSHRALGWGSTLVTWIFMALILFTPLGVKWVRFTTSLAGERFFFWLVLLGSVALALKLLTFPFSIIHQSIEKKYGQSKQSFGSWLNDQFKGIALGAVLGGIALGILYLCVQIFDRGWWLPCAIAYLFFSIVLAQLAPVLLLPLFFKMEPMPGGDLKERLFSLCKKFAVDVKEIYHLGLGEKTEKGNAAFLGLGRTKRIVIGDTIYEKFPHDQVEAVFAHELGHQVHNDLWKGIAVGAGMLVLSFGLSHWITLRWVLPYYRTDFGSGVFVFLFFIVLSVVQLPLGVFQAWYSRSREWAADHFAADKTQTGKVLADAPERLTYQNLGQFKPNALREFLTFSHPAPGRRILKLREGK